MNFLTQIRPSFRGNPQPQGGQLKFGLKSEKDTGPSTEKIVIPLPDDTGSFRITFVDDGQAPLKGLKISFIA